MSTSSLACDESRRASWLARAADYIELTKPRIATLVLVTVAIGAMVADARLPAAGLLLHTLLGTALVAASASAFNQLLERETDSRMNRTADRPLPAGRLTSWEVITFGTVTILVGTLYLGLAVNWLTAGLGLATWGIYAWIYTPMKSRTSFNTAVGAVAGALPVLMGWAATGVPFDLGAWTLFTIVYLWQFPHFMAIAWIYRTQYSDAGLKMLTTVDATGYKAGMQAITSALTLLPISLLPVPLLAATAGALTLPAVIYLVVAFGLGLVYLAYSIKFFRELTEPAARLLLRVSVIYLPLLLGALLVATLA